MGYTRGYMLEFSIAFALSKIKVRGYKGLPSEEGRYIIAKDVVRQLREYPGNPWKLDEEIVPDHLPLDISQRNSNA
jgi:hypothetical protein